MNEFDKKCRSQYTTLSYSNTAWGVTIIAHACMYGMWLLHTYPQETSVHSLFFSCLYFIAYRNIAFSCATASKAFVESPLCMCFKRIHECLKTNEIRLWSCCVRQKTSLLFIFLCVGYMKLCVTCHVLLYMSKFSSKHVVYISPNT